MRGMIGLGARGAAVLACAATMMTPVLASDLPPLPALSRQAAGPAWSPADETAHQYRPWRSRRYRGGGGGSGELIGALLVLGGIAAVAVAIDRSQDRRREHTEGEEYPYPEGEPAYDDDDGGDEDRAGYGERARSQADYGGYAQRRSDDRYAAGEGWRRRTAEDRGYARRYDDQGYVEPARPRPRADYGSAGRAPPVAAPAQSQRPVSAPASQSARYAGRSAEQSAYGGGVAPDEDEAAKASVDRNAAVEACTAEAARSGWIEEINDIEMTEGEWRVRGDYRDGSAFTCSVDAKGQARIASASQA